MNYMNWVIFLFVIGAVTIGGMLYTETNGELDIYNITEGINTPVFNNSYDPLEHSNSHINIERVYNIIYSALNFMTVTSFEVVKMGIEFGYEHPNINWNLIFKLVIYVLVFMLITTLIKPVFYLCIILIMIFIYFKDKVISRRKKRRKKNEKTN